MKSQIFFFLGLLFFAACKPESRSGSTTDSSEASTPATNQPSAPAVAENFPQLPIETLRTLVAECDHIDFTMYNPQLSMSQEMPEVVKATIQHISEAPATHNTANKPNGHVFYQSKGQTLLDADIYLLKEKSYLVFYKDGKPAYANAMAPQGVAFYDNIFSRLKITPQ